MSSLYESILSSSLNMFGGSSGGGEQPTLYPAVVDGGINLISWENNPLNGGFSATLSATIDDVTVTSPLTITPQMDGKTLIITASATNFQSAITSILISYMQSTNSLIAVDTGSSPPTDQCLCSAVGFIGSSSTYSCYKDGVASNELWAVISPNGASTTITENSYIIANATGSFNIFKITPYGSLYSTGFRKSEPSTGTGYYSHEYTFTINVVIHDVDSDSDVFSTTATITGQEVRQRLGYFNAVEGHKYTLAVNATVRQQI